MIAGPMWCTITAIAIGDASDRSMDIGTLTRIHATYDDAIGELEYPNELWPRYDAPQVGDQIARGCGRAMSR